MDSLSNHALGEAALNLYDHEPPDVTLFRDFPNLILTSTHRLLLRYLYRDHVEELSGSAVAETAERCAGPTGEIAFFNIESEVDVVPN